MILSFGVNYSNYVYVFLVLACNLCEIMFLAAHMLIDSGITAARAGADYPEVNTQGCVSRSVIVMERPYVGVMDPQSQFFDIRGIVHFEFQPQGQPVNQTVYKGNLRRLVRSVRDKRWSLLEAHAWMLHHDNTPACTALSISHFSHKEI